MSPLLFESLPIATLLDVFTIHSAELFKHLDIEGCLKYIELIQILKPTIQFSMVVNDSDDDDDFEGQDCTSCPPLSLQHNVHEFLRKSLNLEDETAKILWNILSPIAWRVNPTSGDTTSFGHRHIQSFIDHGIPLGIAFYHFMPPVTKCLDPTCIKKYKTFGSEDSPIRLDLREELSFPITVFTQDFGPIPGTATSSYCHSHFQFLHTTEHVFIERRTLDLFTVMMLTAWTSASNCAKIYNDGITLQSLALSLPAVYSKTFNLDTETVWNSLYLHWLLEDAIERGDTLKLVHDTASQAKRLEPVLCSRNKQMAGTGQEAWNHTCDLCCHFDTDKDGNEVFMCSTVIDGVTIDHPTCAIHECKIPLESVKNRFCPTHKENDAICVVTICFQPAEKGHQTCELSDHRQFEEYNALQNKAMFQLKHHLARLKTLQPQEAIHKVLSETYSNTSDEHVKNTFENPPFSDEEILIDATGAVCDGKPESGNKGLCACFGQKRTHNEELCVGSCGVILGRETFYGSESPTNVWVLWHDNNCCIAAMLNSENERSLDSVALPVDVFHFKSKHKVTDDHCNAFCNPINWEADLCTPDGKWQFNSSAAEQANTWIGGYQSIVCKMQADRYEFFFDQMIKLQNRNLIKELTWKSKNLNKIPQTWLLEED